MVYLYLRFFLSGPLRFKVLSLTFCLPGEALAKSGVASRTTPALEAVGVVT